MADKVQTLAGWLCLLTIVAACVHGASDETTPANTQATQPASTTTTQHLPALGLPPSACCEGVELAAGRYELPPYWGVPLVVDVDEGWRAIFDNSATLVAFVQGNNAVGIPSRWMYLIRAPADLSARAVIDSMAEMTAITAEENTAETNIAGFPAVRLDAAANDAPNQAEAPASGIEAGSMRLEALNDTGYFTTGFLIITATRQSRLRFIALEPGERTMLVMIDAPPDEFEDFATQAEEILESMTPA